MQLKKIDPNDLSFKRWPRTLKEAFGPNAILTVEKRRKPVSEYVWMVVYGVAIGIGWYLIVAIKAGA